MEWVGVVDAASAEDVRARLGSGMRTISRSGDGYVALRVENADVDATPALRRLSEPGWRGLLFGGDVADVTAVVASDGETVATGLLPVEPDAAAIAAEWVARNTSLSDAERRKVDKLLGHWAGLETAAGCWRHSATASTGRTRGGCSAARSSHPTAADLAS